MNTPPTALPADPFAMGTADPMMVQQQQSQQDAFNSFLDQNQQQSMATNHPANDQPSYSYAMPQPQPQFNDNSGTSMNVNMGSNYGSSEQTESSPTMWQRVTDIFKFETYAAYFDVTTHDIKHRITSSVLHFNTPGGFREQVLKTGNNKPDAYGPFWIAATLVFNIALSSNILKWSSGTSEDFDYKIQHLVRAMICVYVFCFGSPFILYTAFSCLSVNVPFAELTCLYGYSLLPYLAATVICVIPVHALIWSALLLAAFVSSVFILRNVVGPIMAAEIHRRGTTTQNTAIAAPLLGTVLGANVIFLLVLKLGFYHF